MLLVRDIVRPLTRGMVRPLVVVGEQVPVQITANILPSLPTLRHGDRLEDRVFGWDDLVLPSNYDSTVADEVLSVAVTYLGDAVDATTPLSAGQAAGYRLTVTGDQGSARVFEFLPVAVYATLPDQVTGLIATGGDAQVSLQWEAPAFDGGAPVSDYRIERNIAGAGWTVVADGIGTGLSYVDTGRTNGDPHQYRVAAINTAGIGPTSSVDGATPNGDTVSPVISATSWDDATKTISFTVSETCTLQVATHLATDAPVADGLGGWSSPVTETFSQVVDGSGTFTLVLSDETVDQISYYVRDAAGNDSAELISAAVTFAPVGSDFVDDFERADEPLGNSPNWDVVAGSMNIVSGNVMGGASGRNVAFYQGAVGDDAFVEVTMASNAETQFIYLRAQDQNNAYIFQIRTSGSCRTYRREAGVDTEIYPRFSVTPRAEGDVFRAQIVGTTISLSQNGGAVTTINAGTTFTSGDVGLGVLNPEAGFQSVTLGDV